METNNKTTMVGPIIDDRTVIDDQTKACDPDNNEALNTNVNSAYPAIGVGSIINNRFTLQQLLGSGGMGLVYRAIDLRKKEADDENPFIAIKLLGGTFASHPAAFMTLQREAKKTQTLAHPNIVTVYDFDRDDSVIYMTMEELCGVSLDKVINNDTLNRKQALKMIRDIAVGLAYAHSKGIIHSDLKPGNIYLTDKGQIKILDFGIARAVDLENSKDRFDAASLGALTPKYASLEMFEGAQPDPRDDIYALGIIACELLGSGHPYRGKTAQQLSRAPVKPTLPKSGRLLHRLLQASVMVHASDRPSSVDVFIKRLDFAINGYKKLITALIVAGMVAASNFVYWQYFADNYPALSTLPPAQQQQFHKLVGEANIALAAGDINGALFYLDDAYAIHKTDKAIRMLSAQIMDLVTASTSGADAETKKQIFDSLHEHPAFKEKTGD